MVSEITRFYCKTDMTSSWFLRKAAFHTDFVDGIWKSDHSFFIIMLHLHFSHISHRFGVIRHFILAGNCPLRPVLVVFLGWNTPKFLSYTFFITKMVFLTPVRVFWAIVRENWFTGMGCSSVEEYKKVTLPVYVAPTWRLDRSSDPNQLCQGWWPSWRYQPLQIWNQFI